MKKWRTLLCALMAAAMVPGALYAARVLPVQTQPYIEKKYEGWSGVLRVWSYEGWENGSGTFSGWLNRCIPAYEKQHNGVYVQVQSVEAEALRAFATSGVRPPDMILFPPGLLDGAAGLIPLSDLPLRGAMARCGGGYAAPVAAGGYAWAINVGTMDALLSDWSGVRAAAPKDDAYHSFSAALLALCSGTVAEPSEGPRLSGMDLGLTGPSEPAPSPEAVDRVPVTLSPDFTFSETALTDFINGELDAVLLSPRGLARLRRLSDQGRGPDWRALTDGSVAFTDQILLLGVVDGDEERERLCVEFLLHLLSEDCQKALIRCGAYSVLGAPTGYGSADPRGVIDAALQHPGLIVPNAFGASWREAASRAAREYIEGKRSATDALDNLFPPGT